MATCPHAFSLLQNLSLIPSPLCTLPKLFVLASLVTPYHSLTHCLHSCVFHVQFLHTLHKFCPLSVLLSVFPLHVTGSQFLTLAMVPLLTTSQGPLMHKKLCFLAYHSSNLQVPYLPNQMLFLFPPACPSILLSPVLSQHTTSLSLVWLQAILHSNQTCRVQIHSA